MASHNSYDFDPMQFSSLDENYDQRHYAPQQDIIRPAEHHFFNKSF